MGENNAFLAWLTSAAPPAWLAFIGAAIWGVKTWDVWKARIMAIKAGDDALVGAQWTRLTGEIGRLAGRVEVLEAELQASRDREQAERKARIEAEDRAADERAGRLQAEALLMARQQGDERIQRRVSEERDIDARRREEGR